jgi:adenosylhomocysteine nucleosidase
LFPRFEIPLTGLTRFASDRALTERLAAAAEKPRVHRGLIASGDQFIGKRQQIVALKEALPDILAVEMEGAAVAQVCFELGIPFAVIRTISDNANDDAAVDFMRFIKTVASRYALTSSKTSAKRA